MVEEIMKKKEDKLKKIEERKVEKERIRKRDMKRLEHYTKYNKFISIDQALTSMILDVLEEYHV